MVGLVGLIVGVICAGASYRQGFGAVSPGQAVERLLLAVERGDAVGAAQVVLPSEGRLLAFEGELAIRQLRRFRSDGFSGAATTGSSKVLRWSIDSVGSQFLQIEGEQATVKVLVPDYPRDNPNVDSVTQGLNETRAGTWTRHFLSATGKDGDRSFVVVTVRSGGRWYVSAVNTSAQAWDRLSIRKQKAKLVRAFDRPKSEAVPVGASSPEQAVQRWLDALVDLDYGTVLTLTNPVEAKAFPIEALQTVWGVRIEKLRRQFELTVADSTRPAQKRTTRFGSSTVVPITIEDANFALTEPGAEPFVSQYHLGCLVILSGGRATKHCGRQIPRFGDQFSIPVSKPTIDRFVGRLDALAAARKALPGLVVVQHDGAWFVSPTQSLLLNLGAGLANAKRADIEALVVDVENAISSDG